MTRAFYGLRVCATHEHIGGLAKSVMFDVPPGLTERFRWRPGQHITLRFGVGGEEQRRSYSISSSPLSGEPLRITVKRVEGGIISNHIVDNVKSGDTVDVMAPFGGFCLDPDRALRRTHYFFGAGSGITPLSSMVHSVLIGEPHSAVHLVYGNRSADTIIFVDALEQLSARYPDRLSVAHVLSRPSMWSGRAAWRHGIIDAATVEAAINALPPYAQDTQYYICGPGQMNRTVRSALLNLDVPAGRIHSESYGGSVEIDDTVAGVGARARIALDGDSVTVAVTAGQTLLEAMRAAKLDAPFSCQSGVCGACRAQLKTGTVHLRARMALDDDDIDGGAILTCQSVPTSPEVSIDID